ncbi:MAG TPA: hypothetical protein VGI30_04945 [Caulobacteraceae bacterium]|jgi:hypothetical protein
MKAALGAAAALICLTGNVQAAALQACDLTLAVIDADPRGTNVRATPGGKVTVALKTSPDPEILEDWIEVHVIGQSGDWFLIDGAKDMGDNEKTIFRGKGYMHRNVLGASGLENGFPLWSDHNEKSRMIAKAPTADQTVTFLDCWGYFAKIRVSEGLGWSENLCTNQRTTCP